MHPFLLIAFTALCVTAAELLFKRGANATAGGMHAHTIFGVSVLQSYWTWLGILAYSLSFISWLMVLRRMPLHRAFAMMSVVQALVPLGAWWLLGEYISSGRWCGIALVLLGLIVIAEPAVKAEDRL